MLSKSTEYAIRAAVYIIMQNNNGLRPGFKEIAREINSPEEFTAKILQKLTKSGLLRSMKGRGGGFFLNNDHSDLNLFDVINLLEGPEYFNRCGFGLKSCSAVSPCPIHDEYVIIRDIYYQLTRKTSIQSLANKISSQKAVLNRLSNFRVE